MPLHGIKIIFWNASSPSSRLLIIQDPGIGSQESDSDSSDGLPAVDMKSRSETGKSTTSQRKGNVAAAPWKGKGRASAPTTSEPSCSCYRYEV